MGCEQDIIHKEEYVGRRSFYWKSLVIKRLSHGIFVAQMVIPGRGCEIAGTGCPENDWKAKDNLKELKINHLQGEVSLLWTIENNR